MMCWEAHRKSTKNRFDDWLLASLKARLVGIIPSHFPQGSDPRGLVWCASLAILPSVARAIHQNHTTSPCHQVTREVKQKGCLWYTWLTMQKRITPPTQSTRTYQFNDVQRTSPANMQRNCEICEWRLGPSGSRPAAIRATWRLRRMRLKSHAFLADDVWLW